MASTPEEVLTSSAGAVTDDTVMSVVNNVASSVCIAMSTEIMVSRRSTQ